MGCRSFNALTAIQLCDLTGEVTDDCVLDFAVFQCLDGHSALRLDIVRLSAFFCLNTAMRSFNALTAIQLCDLDEPATIGDLKKGFNALTAIQLCDTQPLPIDAPCDHPLHRRASRVSMP